MKKSLLFILILLCFKSVLQGQTVTFEPTSTHYFQPYPLKLTGNGKMYYTLDGTTPTLNSTSGTNNITILIDRNLEVKVFLVSNNGNTSAIISKKYYTGQITPAQIFFKPPSHWNTSCFYVGMINPNSINGAILDSIYPLSMQNTNCEGWQKNNIALSYENASVSFNNCPLFYSAPGAEFLPPITAGNLLLYDYSLGSISNPPACLNLSTGENRNYTIVKVLPNPADDYVLVKSSLKFETYSIYDYSGKIVAGDQLNSERINVSFLNKGNYIIKFFGKDKNEVFVKFIKK